ncbi:MAG: asparagine synthase (glutamine-hydrolyzing) [Chloroflexi bacterium]|nr:asparagine synthase (glutamine-hydrolyzing) [Chloroflexota bacterium]
MCGIWGAVNVADLEAAQKAARAMQHRGPDDHGFHIAEHPIPVSLVNTRLSIIDLSDAGHQPMCSEDGRYWIVYNGEVYNYEPLRTVLMEGGHSFHSHTDTEVILHAYMQWGSDCLSHLRGMFAFAIWDKETGSLFAARDRLGIKPLYYTHIHRGTQEKLIFASELKAMLSCSLVDARLNMAGLHHFLSFYAVPSPYTLLEDVLMLPPGHYMVYEEGRLTVSQYWNVQQHVPNQASEEDLIVQLRALLEGSIKLRMIADVPVGAFLSGGIDSSVVVALMSQLSGERLRTFSIGFDADGRSLDERSAARLVAKHYDTDHHEVVVTGQHVRDQIDHFIRAMDQPSGDGLNTYLVSQATAEQVKVAVSGLGGDELFAGYPQFRMFQRAETARGVWGSAPDAARSLLRSAAQRINAVDRAMTWLDGDLLDRYERVRILYDEETKMTLYTDTTRLSMTIPETIQKYLSRFVHPAEVDPIAQITRLELSNYMPHTLLRDTDAMSMAHSLEVRVPLIDHKLVEFAANIPSEMKVQGKQSKAIFIKAVQDLLPKSVLNRPKRGFEMPVAVWMRHELRDVVEDVFSADSIQRRGLFKQGALQGIYQDFQRGQGPYMRVWALVTLELWMRQFIDQAL